MATMMKRSRQLSKCIVTPERLAQILDWKRNARGVLALDITPQTVGMAVSTDLEKNDVETLPPITSYRRHVEQVTSRVQNLMEEYKVEALVVQWPVRPDGRLGKPCGHVLHVLDHLAATSEPLVSPRRPFALWTTTSPTTNPHANHIRRSCIGSMRVRDLETTADEWGRSTAFCLSEEDAKAFRESTEPLVYRSSMHEQQDDDKTLEGTSLGAQVTLQGFLQTFWSTCDNDDDDDWKDDFFAYRYSSHDDALLFPAPSSASQNSFHAANARAAETSAAHFLDVRYIQSRLL